MSRPAPLMIATCPTRADAPAKWPVSRVSRVVLIACAWGTLGALGGCANLDGVRSFAQRAAASTAVPDAARAWVDSAVVSQPFVAQGVPESAQISAPMPAGADSAGVAGTRVGGVAGTVVGRGLAPSGAPASGPMAAPSSINTGKGSVPAAATSKAAATVPLARTESAARATPASASPRPAMAQAKDSAKAKDVASRKSSSAKLAPAGSSSHRTPQEQREARAAVHWPAADVVQAQVRSDPRNASVPARPGMPTAVPGVDAGRQPTAGGAGMLAQLSVDPAEGAASLQAAGATRSLASQRRAQAAQALALFRAQRAYFSAMATLAGDKTFSVDSQWRAASKAVGDLPESRSATNTREAATSLLRAVSRHVGTAVAAGSVQALLNDGGSAADRVLTALTQVVDDWLAQVRNDRHGALGALEVAAAARDTGPLVRSLALDRVRTLNDDADAREARLRATLRALDGIQRGHQALLASDGAWSRPGLQQMLADIAQELDAIAALQGLVEP